MLPLFRAVVVWAVILASALLPRLEPPAPASQASVAVTQLSAYDRLSVLRETREQRVQVMQAQQAQIWSQELTQGLATYKAQQEQIAAAVAEARWVAALNNHPPPPPVIGKIITDAFSPLGQAAVVWALRIAWCESRYHTNSVNKQSGATGLFQFMAGTWAGTPWAKDSRFDAVANAQAAAWLYSHYGPGRWSCK